MSTPPDTSSNRAKALANLQLISTLPEDDPDLFSYLWVAVKRILQRTPALARSIANQEEFLANVENSGVDRFSNLVRAAKEEDAWENLVNDGDIHPLPTITLIMTST